MWLYHVIIGLCLSHGIDGVFKITVGDDLPPATDKNKAPTCELAAMEGYECETHEVTTQDNFVLNVHRLLGNKTKRDPSLSPVLLQHGLLDSSADWIISGPQNSLAYNLADLGYDVWMGNARGNTYSRTNHYLPPHDPRLWSWSWHEMGYYDLPAVIDHMLAKTNHQQIFYVGHSMGTTMFFVLCSTRPEYNAKVRYMAAFAPVSFMKHTASPIRYLAPYANNIEKIANFFGKGEFLPRSNIMDYFFKFSCETFKFESKICENYLFLICGFDPVEFDKNLIPMILGHNPAGTSTKTLVHYAQGINTDYFRQYDYGTAKNILVYGMESPPEYNLSLITAPISLHYGENDLLTTPKDIFNLFGRLKSPLGLFKVNQSTFNHLDFLYGRDVKTLLYDQIIAFFKRFKDGSVNCIDPTSIDYVAELCENSSTEINIVNAIEEDPSNTTGISKWKSIVMEKFNIAKYVNW